MKLLVLTILSSILALTIALPADGVSMEGRNILDPQYKTCDGALCTRGLNHCNGVSASLAILIRKPLTDISVASTEPAGQVQVPGVCSESGEYGFLVTDQILTRRLVQGLSLLFHTAKVDEVPTASAALSAVSGQPRGRR